VFAYVGLSKNQRSYARLVDLTHSPSHARTHSNEHTRTGKHTQTQTHTHARTHTQKLSLDLPLTHARSLTFTHTNTHPHAHAGAQGKGRDARSADALPERSATTFPRNPTWEPRTKETAPPLGPYNSPMPRALRRF
jgi:hypothetical protein